jgi:integrase/recombinase XerC
MIERYIEKFIRYLEIEKNYSRYTILNYRLDLQDFRNFLAGLDIEKIDYLTLRKYLAVLKEKNLGTRSVGRHLSTPRRFTENQSYLEPFQP